MIPLHLILILVLAHSLFPVPILCSSLTSRTGSTSSSLASIGSERGTTAADSGSSSSTSACCHIAGTPKLDDEASQSLLPKKMAFLIGAQKSGTTFLFNALLARHPHILSQVARVPDTRNSSLKAAAKAAASRGEGRGGSEKAASAAVVANLTRFVSIKEPHYFDRVVMGSFDEYLSKFGTTAEGSSVNPSAVYLDATPDYIHIPSAPCRIAAAFPDAKLIVVLREPAQRALSGWNMVRHRGKEAVDAFAHEVAEELRVLRHFNCSFEPLPADSARSSESAPAAAAAGKNMMRSKAAATPSSGAAVSAAAKGSAKDDASKQRGRPGAAAAKAAASNAASLNNYTAEDAEDDATKVAAAEATAEADLERLSGGRALLATGAEAKAELDLSPPMVKAPKGKAPKPHTPEGSRRRSSSSGIGWERSPGLPSWNDCFRCMFSYCGGYEGPRAGGVCTESLGRTFLRRGLYVYQLEWWLRHFPAEQLMVINYEQLENDPEAVIDRVIAFLGLDMALKRKQSEVHKEPRGYSTPYNGPAAGTEDVLQSLRSFYAHANAELYRLMEQLGPGSGWAGVFKEDASPENTE